MNTTHEAMSQPDALLSACRQPETEPLDNFGSSGALKGFNIQRTRRVLTPTDFSPASSVAILRGHQLAEEINGELLLLYVALPTNHHDASLNARETDLRANQLHKRAERLLWKQLGETIGVGGKVRVQLLIREGFAYERIVKEAELHGAEYIVIGKHGRSDDQSLLLGPTAESVIRHARCPVVLVDNIK